VQAQGISPLSPIVP